MKPIGILKAIRRYPVKSMRGEDLKETLVTYSGLPGDRVYALLDPEKTGNFAWLTARQVSEMILFEPRFVDKVSVDEKFPPIDRWKNVEVKTPEGLLFKMDDPAFQAFLEKRWNKKFHLRFSERGMQDSRPVSIFSIATLQALAAEASSGICKEQFRANFYVEWNSDAPFFEESTLNSVLQVGEKLKLIVEKKISRCVIINLDPATATSNPAILKTVGKNHKGNAGVYAAVITEGVVKVGDTLFLDSPP